MEIWVSTLQDTILSLTLTEDTCILKSHLIQIDMKKVTLQITMNVLNNYPLNNSDDIQQLMIDFPHNTVFMNGKVI